MVGKYRCLSCVYHCSQRTGYKQYFNWCEKNKKELKVLSGCFWYKSKEDK